MAFLESGEYQYNSPLLLFGEPVIAKVDGKDVAARLVASGTWESDGDRLRVRITQTNQSNLKFDGPTDCKVMESTDKKLVLKQEDGTILAVFRQVEAAE